MKAKDIKPGMVIDGWTVTTASGRVVVFGAQPVGDDVVLLTLERTQYDRPDWLKGQRAVGMLTKRTWYRADEDVAMKDPLSPIKDPLSPIRGPLSPINDI